MVDNLTWVAGGASIVGLAIAILSVAGGISAPSPSDTELFLAFMITMISLIVVCLSFSYVLYKSSKKQRDLYAQIQLLRLDNRWLASTDGDHAQIYGVLNYLIFYIDRYQVGSLEFLDENGDLPDAMVEEFVQFHAEWSKRIGLSILNNAVQIFERITGDSCSACIKRIDVYSPYEISLPNGSNGLVPSTYLLGHNLGDVGAYFVETFIRDTISREDRNAYAVAGAYSVSDNTAFSNILDGRFPSSHFVSNDLASDQTYKNSNPNWNKFYNTTLVVPIYVPMAVNILEVKDYERKIIGFLCIDSKHAKLDTLVCLNVAKVLARLAGFTMSGSAFTRESDENGPEKNDENDDQTGSSTVCAESNSHTSRTNGEV